MVFDALDLFLVDPPHTHRMDDKKFKFLTVPSTNSESKWILVLIDSTVDCVCGTQVFTDASVNEQHPHTANLIQRVGPTEGGGKTLAVPGRD
ncbi:hypothetical protein BaRGS_00000651 [Batillaria attramentaria]|uniref:Uncharacterized protein n=1 Tax=Batillaria attramentaria TaxID=370345 RepID=A0ABD0M9I9_9CAEN